MSLSDTASEVGEEMHVMSIYAVDGKNTTGTVEAGDETIGARSRTPADFGTPEVLSRDSPNPAGTRAIKIGVDVLGIRGNTLERETTCAELFASHLPG